VEIVPFFRYAFLISSSFAVLSTPLTGISLCLRGLGIGGNLQDLVVIFSHGLFLFGICSMGVDVGLFVGSQGDGKTGFMAELQWLCALDGKC
jgi:hypothetical protein